MANYETTTKMKVDISDLKKSMQEARKQVAYANSEFKAVSSSMDDWSKSSDGLSAKIKQLKSNLESQEKVLEEYEKTLEKVKEEYGENSKEALEYATKLNNQKAVVNKTKKELGNYEETLVEVSKAEKIASKTGKDVAEVLNDVGNEADDAGEGFTVFKGAIASFIGSGLTALVGGLRDAATNILGLAESTREYRDQMAKLESASSDAGYSSKDTAERYKELYGVLADDTATTTTISNFMAMGAEGKTLDSLLNSSIGIWSKYGDSIPLDGLAEAINHSSKLGSVQGNLSDALEWSGISVDDFNAQLEKCSTEQERQELIASTLDGLYGDLADTYKENNKSIIEANEAQADYNKVMGELGAKVEPITTGLKKGFTDVLKEAMKLFGGSVDVEAFTGKMEEGFKVITDKVLPAVKEGLGWIVENKDAIIAGLAGIASGFVAFKVAGIITGAVGAFKTLFTTIKAGQGVMVALNAAFGITPIGMIVTAVGLLVAGFIYLWNTCEPFKQFWLDLWEGIKNATSIAIEAIGKFFTETLPSFIDKAVEFFSQLPEKIMGWLQVAKDNISQWGSDLLNKAIETGKGFLENVIQFFSDLPYKIGYALGYAIAQVIQWGIDLYNFATTEIPKFVDRVIEFIKKLPSKIYTWLVNVIDKVNQWRNDMLAKAKEVATGFVNKVVEFIKNLPSKVQNWLTNTLSNIAKWGSDLAVKGKEAGQKLLNAIIEKVKEIPGDIKEIGSDIVEGLWNGINDMSGWIKGKISGFSEGVLKGIKDFFKIKSPSRLMADEVGKWIPAGLAVGITDNAKSAIKAVKDLSIGIVGEAKDGLSKSATMGSSGGVVNNFYQTINSPKQLSRLEIYRQSKNLLGYAGGV